MTFLAEKSPRTVQIYGSPLVRYVVGAIYLSSAGDFYLSFFNVHKLVRCTANYSLGKLAA